MCEHTKLSIQLLLFLNNFTKVSLTCIDFFFQIFYWLEIHFFKLNKCHVWDSNFDSSIYYALFIPTELSLPGPCIDVFTSS